MTHGEAQCFHYCFTTYVDEWTSILLAEYEIYKKLKENGYRVQKNVGD